MSQDLVKVENRTLDMWSNNEMLAQIKEIYGKGLSNGEFETLVQLGRNSGLNPFLKEVWAVKFGNNPAQIFIGRDGYRKGAQANRDYDYHQVDAVYSNDEYHYQPSTGEVHHKYNFKDRGQLMGAYGLTKRRNSSRPHYIFVELNEYDKKQSNWKSMPATMIKKVAEAQVLRMAFQDLFAGTYDGEVEQFDSKPSMQVMNAERSKDINKILGMNNGDVIDGETGEVKAMASKEQIQELRELLQDGIITQDIIDKWLKVANAKTFEELTEEQILKCSDFVKRRKEYLATKDGA